MLTLTDDVAANGPFMLAHYGAYYALGFKGEPDFIQRCFNWAVNTGVIGPGGQIQWFYEAETGRLAYVCPKSLHAIKRGLFLQFQAEIIQAKEVALKADHSRDDEWIDVHHAGNKFDGTPLIDYNDYQIARLAGKRVKEFLRDHVVKDAFFLRKSESVGPIYGMARKGRAESAFE